MNNQNKLLISSPKIENTFKMFRVQLTQSNSNAYAIKEDIMNKMNNYLEDSDG